MFSQINQHLEDDIVDLCHLFGKPKAEGHTKEYLDSFINMAIFWDKDACSDNLLLSDPIVDARHVIS